jgi:hypothetical protein
MQSLPKVFGWAVCVTMWVCTVLAICPVPLMVPPCHCMLYVWSHAKAPHFCGRISAQDGPEERSVGGGVGVEYRLHCLSLYGHVLCTRRLRYGGH